MASPKRAKHAKRPERANKASGLAFAVGLGMAVASGHGIASAATGDSQSSGSTDSDTGSKSTTTTDSGTTASGTSGSTGTSGTTSTTGSTTSTTTQPTTTSTGSEATTKSGSSTGPTSTVSASGGAGTTVSGQTTGTTSSTTPTTTASTATAQSTTTGPTGTGSGTTTPTTEAAPTTEAKPKSSITATEQAATPTADIATPAAGTAAAETASVPVETTSKKTLATTAAPAAKMMVMSAAATTTTTSPGLPTITLPPYPTIPGVSPTKVAVAVLLVLGKALETAISGPIPNPLAIPLYMLVVAAYQRLAEIAYNHVPVAGTPSTPLQVPLTGIILGNIGTATDQDGDPLRYTVTTQPTKGTVALLGTAYTYTPSAAMLRDGGTDSFTVTIDDLQGAADHFYAPNGHTTTETINLTEVGTGIDIAPLVTATQGPRDSIGVVKGGFTVIDPDDTTHTFSLANGNSAGATAKSAFSSLGGIVSLNTTTGNWTYIPAVSGNLLGIPTHTDSFVVTVDDGHAGGAVQTTVTVGADLETAVTGTSTNPTNGAYSGGLNVPAADTGLLTYSVGTPPSSKGNLVVNPDGTFTYTPTAAARHAAAANNATTADKTDSFTIVGTDANGRQVTVATVPVTISATNAAPTASYSVTSPGSNGLVTGIIIANDGDNDTLSYGPTTTNTGKGTVTVNATTGTFSYQPTATAMHAASANNATTAQTQDTFTINVDDGHGAVTPVSVTASIKPQNTAPTVSYGTPVKVPLVGTATYTPTSTDADGDSVTYTVTTQPTHGTILVNLSLLGVTTLIYTPSNGLSPAHDSFTVTVADGHGGTVVTTLNPY